MTTAGTSKENGAKDEAGQFISFYKVSFQFKLNL